MHNYINFAFFIIYSFEFHSVKNSFKVVLIIFVVLFLDQALKFYIKTTFCYGEERSLLGLSWARLNFVENPGMAFGLEYGGAIGKLFLSVFRLCAIGLMIYIALTVKRFIPFGLLLGFSLILAGAIGNIIDSAFYGIVFSESDFHCITGPAKFLPPQGGYANFLHGRVVDMLYFPMFQIPKKIPYFGGSMFFQPVFNLADASITIGVAIIFLFYRRFFNSEIETTEQKSESVVAE